MVTNSNTGPSEESVALFRSISGQKFSHWRQVLQMLLSWDWKVQWEISADEDLRRPWILPILGEARNTPGRADF